MTSTKVKVLEIKEFEKSTYEFREDGIVSVTIKDDSHIEMADTLEEFKFISQMHDYLPMRLLVNPGKNTSISKEVRDHINTPEAKNVVKCQAIIVNSLAHKIMVNFIIKLYKKPGTLKIFSNEEDAIIWLDKNK